MDGIVTHAAYKQDVPVKRAVCIASPHFDPVVSTKRPLRVYDIKLLAITISFIACTSSVKACNGNSR